MKQCPINEIFYAFETAEEFEQAFAKFAEENGEELSDDLCIEGNSGLCFETVRYWVDYFGLENVYFEGVDDISNAGHIAEFCFDLKNAKHNGEIYFCRPDEMSFKNGFRLYENLV